MILNQAKTWLAEAAIPLWLKHGMDFERGGFIESLDHDARPIEAPWRGLVQARQIYSLRIAAEMGACSPEESRRAIDAGVSFLLEKYSLPHGGFVRSIDRADQPVENFADLYSQAFALFGMAHAHAVTKESRLKARAHALLAYLQTDRRLPNGGYSEIQAGQTGKILRVSNPHMHLFEAALAWMEEDPSEPVWGRLADEVFALCRDHLIDADTGILAEHFDEEWRPVLHERGFVFEPGHQYEWAWLLGRYGRHRKIDLTAMRARMIEAAERNGVCATRHAPFDELWSDLTVKSSTSRLWPHCERVKAAVRLAEESSGPARVRYVAMADEGMRGLFRYFEVKTPGLWLDVWTESGEFLKNQPVRASSFYHIVGALSEYAEVRPRLS